MKRIITTSLMLVLIAACSFAQSIVGKWKALEPTMKDAKQTFVNEIKDAFAGKNEGTYTIRGNVLDIDGMKFTRVR